MKYPELLKLEQDVDWLINAYKDEKAIVTNIWALLGNPSYAELAGRSIYDLILAKDKRIQDLEAEVAVLGEDLAEEKINNSQFGVGA